MPNPWVASARRFPAGAAADIERFVPQMRLLRAGQAIALACSDRSCLIALEVCGGNVVEAGELLTVWAVFFVSNPLEFTVMIGENEGDYF